MSNHDGQKRDHRCRTSRRHQPPEVPWHATCHRQRKIASTDPITRESHSTSCGRLSTEQEPVLGMSQPRIPRPQISSPDAAWATVAMAWVSGEPRPAGKTLQCRRCSRCIRTLQLLHALLPSCSFYWKSCPTGTRKELTERTWARSR